MAPFAERKRKSGGSVGSSSRIRDNPEWKRSLNDPVKECCSHDENESTTSSSVHVVDGWCGAKEGVAPPWMDWVESGIEFFGCEADTGKSMIGRALMMEDAPSSPLPLLRRISKPRPPQEDPNRFLHLHEQFFEALLKEQWVNAGNASGPDDFSDVPGLEPASSYDESINSGVSSTSSLTHDTESISSTKTQKRRRPLRLHRLSPKKKHHLHARVAPIEAYNRMYNPDHKDDGSVCLSLIAQKNLPEPISFLDPRVKLQKDKGKGDPLGSVTSAEGKEACLQKIREKMAIVLQVSADKPHATTGIKRRRAKISQRTHDFLETRSMLELRLGFLSMQYGLLLQWRDGKIVFIVLRKMCHDSFYSKIPEGLGTTPEPSSICPLMQQLEPPPLVVRNVMGNHAIYQRLHGTEVVLVDKPYRVPQPEVFCPAVLTVGIKTVAGLSKKSRWTISLTFDGHTESAHLHYNSDDNIHEVKRSPCTWEMNDVSTSFDVTGLEIRLFEQQKYKRKHSHSRLASTTTLPLGGLVAQPFHTQSTSWQLTLPIQNNGCAINLTLQHHSDYAHWLYKELEARRKELIVHYPNYPHFTMDDDIQSASQELLDWFCGICFRDAPDNL